MIQLIIPIVTLIIFASIIIFEIIAIYKHLKNINTENNNKSFKYYFSLLIKIIFLVFTVFVGYLFLAVGAAMSGVLNKF